MAIAAAWKAAPRKGLVGSSPTPSAQLLYMEEKISVKKLANATKDALKDINMLLLQLSSRKYQMDMQQLKSVLEDKNNMVMVLRDHDLIVGMITLVILHQTTGNKGYIEDLVVDEKYRGKGFGEKLVRHAIATARKMKLDSVELKSERYRMAANKLYHKLGFEMKDANVYKIKLS